MALTHQDRSEHMIATLSHCTKSHITSSMVHICMYEISKLIIRPPSVPRGLGVAYIHARMFPFTYITYGVHNIHNIHTSARADSTPHSPSFWDRTLLSPLLPWIQPTMYLYLYMYIYIYIRSLFPLPFIYHTQYLHMQYIYLSVRFGQ